MKRQRAACENARAASNDDDWQWIVHKRRRDLFFWFGPVVLLLAEKSIYMQQINFDVDPYRTISSDD